MTHSNCKIEVNKNRYIIKAFAAIATLFIIVLFLNISGIFKIKSSAIYITAIPCSILLFLPLPLLHYEKLLQNYNVKYFLLAISAVVTLVTTVGFNFHVVILYTLPVIVAMQYHTKKIAVYAVVVSCGCAVLAPAIACMTTWDSTYIDFLARVQENVSIEGLIAGDATVWTYVVKVFIYLSLGYVLSIVAFSLILFSVNKQGRELDDLRLNLELRVDERTMELREKSNTLQELSVQSIEALAKAIDAKDQYTNGHSQRVAEYSVEIAKRMKKTQNEQDHIYYIALLHDIGKIGIPDEIINKTSRLTDEEFDMIKTHTTKGYEILSAITTMPEICTGARWHHEKFDGSGYPDHLREYQIPEIARIISVADAYDAMTSNRSYRNAMPYEKVKSEIEKGRGTQFDPDIADIMLKIIEKKNIEETKGQETTA